MREVDDDNDPPTCERCHCEYTMDHGDEPTRFCDACAHHVAESSADALELLEKLRAHPGNTPSASVDEYAEFDRLLLQLLKGGG